MEARITNFIKTRLAGDYQIWFIVFLLNIFGLLIQFSAKGKMLMGGPLVPIANIAKSIFLLAGSFALMSWISRQNYLRLAKYSNICLIFSWLLILFAFFFGENKGGASRWIDLAHITLV
jgi:cell division protein FtsW